MNRLIEWLLDLDDIRLGRDAPLMLKWDSPFAAWELFGVALVVIVCVVLAYRRERASLVRRIVLATTRCGLLALIVAVLCRPSLVLERNRVEPSHVVLILDESLSMATTDLYGGGDLARAVAAGAGVADVERIADHSRLHLVVAALLKNDAAPLRRLLERNGVRLCGFADAVEPRGYFATPETVADLAAAIEATVPDGTGTDLGGAIKHVIDKTQGRRLAAIVLASDGQATRGAGLKDTLDLARGRQIPIFPLRIGAPHRPLDVEVGLVRAQDRVFRDDVLAVEARLTGHGLSGPTTVTVMLVDERSDTVVATEEVVLSPDEPSLTVELRTKPGASGLVRYRVEVPPLPRERVTQNNSERVDVTVLENRLRVLLVDGYPRYEYRYLKNAFLREETVQLSVLLIEADDAFVQEGTDPIRRFPTTPEELNRYDVVLMGDVDPAGGFLTLAQMKMLLDFVGNEGGGFGLIAGERFAPYRFLGTPLEKLIPVRVDPTFYGRYDAPLTGGFLPRLTAEGRRSGIFRFASDRDESVRLFEALPELYWYARTLGPRPGASVLLEHPTVRTPSGPMPVVVTGRYGAGMLFFQATDDTWRWRRHTGEFLHDTYWIQVVRELMRGSRAAGDRRLVVRSDRRSYPYGTAVQCRVEVFDAQLLAEHPEEISMVVAEPGADPVGATPVVVGRFLVHRLGPESHVFEGTWMPPRQGSYVIATRDISPRRDERRSSALIRVEKPDLEARHPEADHEMLERIAASTGGSVIDLDDLEEAFGAIRDRSVRIPDDIVEPLWDSKLVLVVFALMISMEWVLRKAFGLL